MHRQTFCSSRILKSRPLASDQADAAAYWRDKEIKVFAVDLEVGPHKRPDFSATHYARARSRERAIACVKRQLPVKPPLGTRFAARLAGPYELGCVPTLTPTSRPPASFSAIAARPLRDTPAQP